jgi:hypothetical protein
MRKFLRRARQVEPALYTIGMLLTYAVSVYAQDPFTVMATKISVSAVLIARILGVVAMIGGGLRMAMGDHGAKGSIASIAGGLCIAIFAPQIMAWLFT